MKEIKCSQIGKLLIYIVPATKLLLLPVILTDAAGRDSYLAVGLMYLLDIAVMSLLLFTLRNSGNVTFSEFLKSFTNWVRIPVLILFALQFLLKAFLPIVEQKLFLQDSFYQKISAFAFYLPVMILILFIAVKSVRVYGRLAELLFVLTIISFGLIFLLALAAFEPSELLPFCYDGFGPVVKGCFQIVSWFGDSLLLVLFFGRISDSKNVFKTILPLMGVCMLLTVLFMVLFTGIFGAVAVRQIFALSKISRYNLILSEVGRFDWFAILVLLGGILFNAAVNVGAAVSLLRDCLGLKKKTWVGVGACAVLLGFGLFAGDNFIAIYDFYAKFGMYFFLFMQYVMPVILFLLSLLFRRRYEKVPV